MSVIGNHECLDIREICPASFVERFRQLDRVACGVSPTADPVVAILIDAPTAATSKRPGSRLREEPVGSSISVAPIATPLNASTLKAVLFVDKGIATSRLKRSVSAPCNVRSDVGVAFMHLS